MKYHKTKGIFITGSGTGVGKTFVSKIMLAEFLRMGYKTAYMKPVETGCAYRQNEPDRKNDPIGADVLEMLDTIGDYCDPDLLSPYRFEPACSPHLAARMAGREIDIGHIAAAYEKLCEETAADIVIAEGAGGVLAPVSDSLYMADVIAALGMPAVLVTGPELGTLNHTFLSLRELERRGIPAAGVVINNARGIERGFIFEDNANTIKRYVDPKPCQVVNYNDNGSQLTEFCNEVFSHI